MIEGIPILGIGTNGLLALVILLILTDKLVWHRRLRVLEKQLEAEKDQNAELVKQNGLLLESAVPTVNAVLGALREAAELETP